MTYDDIEYHWQNILRTYKKIMFYYGVSLRNQKILIRKELVMVYDEDENISFS